MIDFHSNRTIKATRKAHHCEQCGRVIEIGSPAIYGAGKYGGYMYSNYTHTECFDAALAYAELNGMWDEDWPWFQHMENGEHDHHEWLLKHHPVVADRLNIAREPEVA